VLSTNRKVVGGDGRQLIYVPMPAGNGTGGSAADNTPNPPVLPADVASPTVNATTGDIRPERSARPTGREEPSR
jgi:membrane protease subunit HflK